MGWREYDEIYLSPKREAEDSFREIERVEEADKWLEADAEELERAAENF